MENEIIYWILGGFAIGVAFAIKESLAASKTSAVVQETVKDIKDDIGGIREIIQDIRAEVRMFYKAEKEGFEEALKQNTQALKDLAK